MRISVVNFSSVNDDDVQEVIRAVNRQLIEDFAPYWHRTGVLRLEGTSSKGVPSPETARELRGDAILYLQDDPDDDSTLGYHELNLRGVPFGFVFLDLAKKLGEHWSITFSHEALELVMDPEANLLTSGPHPADPGRTVQHWYEVCDAVQAQHYLIDNVKVSNFVTPLFFTTKEEDGCRNDFLGASGRKRQKLPSFGVAPGGYLGFFDPETGEHESFTAGDPVAQKRLDIKNRAGWARRGVRHQGKMSPDMVRRLVTGCATGEPLPGPWFEGFAIDVRAKPGDIPLDHLYNAAALVIGRNWHSNWEVYETTPANSKRSYFEYDLVPLPGKPKISRAHAFELSYQLAEQKEILLVEPNFVYLNPDLDALNEKNSPRRASGVTPPHILQSKDPNWCRDKMNLEKAWEQCKGSGVLIGHPDTGYLRHPEVEDSAHGGPVRLDLGWDFEDDDSDAKAELDDDTILPGGPNHGTATASVIVSPPGANPPSGTEFVVGAAPEAQLVPIRVANSVVHFSMRRIRYAIRHAVDQGCQVISMSLGGPFPSRKLHEEIQRATEQGVIIISAAGNHIPFGAVIFPAHYSEVVAVAASNAADEPWSGSSRGSKIDITAPGESVYRALVEQDENGKEVKTSKRSSGTSYATAHIAGVCALWIQKWGHAALKNRYDTRVAEAFKEVLRVTAREGKNMDPDDFVGIVDAAKVLDHPLPTLAALQSKAKLARRVQATQDDVLDNIHALLPHHSKAVLRTALATMFGMTTQTLDATMETFGAEMFSQLATDQRLLQDFDAQVRASKELGPRKARNSTTRRSMGNLNRRLRSISISPSLKKALTKQPRKRKPG